MKACSTKRRARAFSVAGAILPQQGWAFQFNGQDKLGWKATIHIWTVRKISTPRLSPELLLRSLNMAKSFEMNPIRLFRRDAFLAARWMRIQGRWNNLKLKTQVEPLWFLLKRATNLFGTGRSKIRYESFRSIAFRLGGSKEVAAVSSQRWGSLARAYHIRASQGIAARSDQAGMSEPSKVRVIK